MSYNGSGTFVINSSGQPVVTGTVISSTAFNALTADLATGLSTAITKDGQTTTTARVPFAQGISSTLVTDATSATTGSIITAGGISTQKALWVGTTSRLVGNVQADANIGIGCSPATPLNISGSGALIRLDGPSTTSSAYISFTHAGSGVSAVGLDIAGGTLITSSPANSICIRNDMQGILFSTGGAGAEVARFDTSGRLGIGMTPSNMLDITKSANTQARVSIYNNSAGNVADADFLANNGTSYLLMTMYGTGYTASGINRQDGALITTVGTGGMTLATTAAYPLYFGVNTAEVARFDTSGNLLVGTTGSPSNARFRAYGNASAVFDFGPQTAAANTAFVVFNTGGAGAYLTSGSGTWSSTSDIRLKDITGTYESPLEDIAKIQVIKYTWKNDDLNTPQVGVTAQSVQHVVPEAISECQVIPNDETKYLGVRYTELVPLLISSIQELTTRLAALESK